MINLGFPEGLAGVQEVCLVIDGRSMPLKISNSNGAIQLEQNPSAPNSFIACGNTWEMCYGGIRVVMKNQRGFAYINQLLGKPMCEISSSVLVASVNGEAAEIHKAGDISDECFEGEAEGDRRPKQAIVKMGVRVDAKSDLTARKLVRARLTDLQTQHEFHKANGELRAAEDLEEEIEKLNGYLQANFVCGRSKDFITTTDRNRRSVHMAIKRALEIIDSKHLTLAKHLKNSIRTGFSCSYVPERDIEWVL